MKNNNSPLISVLMPVYNGADYLKEAISSILNQTFTDFEFIIINDGSTDRSEDVILRFQDTRIRYVKNDENIGLIKTLNRGLDFCKGEFIARMDQDDISHPERFTQQVKVLEENPEIGVCGTWFTLFGGKIDKTPVCHPQFHAEIKIKLLGYSTLGHPTVMMRKKLFSSIRYDENYQATEDYALWVTLSELTEFYNIPELLLDYRMHNTNITILEGSIQHKNSNKIRAKQLKKLGIEASNEKLSFCEILFAHKYVKSINSRELKRIVKFANQLETKNKEKKIYSPNSFHKIISERLNYVFEKSPQDSFLLIIFLLLNRKDVILQRGIKNTFKKFIKKIIKKK